ncbi:acyl-CoA thioesterase [Pontibacillus sp. ALD_SL1]|uniref:acyl-CoA thioesterase n=1 Tax=Pontibacillus sp. ALD_SL1 TaxID=2777185 RepID=UPI001A968D7A|nr:thioesterase family protein [Pontibacillus sp. ALD_SL1]QST01694.1 acyl-CoA thioesterase [Pontibacillus sp. ALD_SL1]
MMITTTEVKVRYQETDQMGVVYHANYLVWFELGRTAFIEALGFQYHEMESSGVVSPVVDANIQFKTPLRYGQTAIVNTWLEYYDGIRVTYGYEIQTPNGEVAVTGATKHVCVKKESFKPVSIRRVFPEWHEAYMNAKGES